MYIYSFIQIEIKAKQKLKQNNYNIRDNLI